MPDKSKRVLVDLARIDYWISVGASMSDRVATLVKKVKTNRFGIAKAPPAMQAPKEPAPPAPPETEGDAAPATEEAAPSE